MHYVTPVMLSENSRYRREIEGWHWYKEGKRGRQGMGGDPQLAFSLGRLTTSVSYGPLIQVPINPPLSDYAPGRQQHSRGGGMRDTVSKEMTPPLGPGREKVARRAFSSTLVAWSLSSAMRRKKGGPSRRPGRA